LEFGGKKLNRHQNYDGKLTSRSICEKDRNHVVSRGRKKVGEIRSAFQAESVCRGARRFLNLMCWGKRKNSATKLIVRREPEWIETRGEEGGGKEPAKYRLSLGG